MTAIATDDDVVRVRFEFLDLGHPDYERISALVRETYPRSCICWIERVHNPDLYTAYLARQAAVGEEHLLFHGTCESSARAIARHGFDPAKNKTSAFGLGSYFAKAASYSFSYMKDDSKGIGFMLLCRVASAKRCLGARGMPIDTTLYDSACNALHAPTIFVTPFPDGAYPEFIICFHKTAK
jgi:hypothetical protein